MVLSVTNLGGSKSLQASTLHQNESMKVERWPLHGSNADKHQLLAGVMGGTVPHALCGDAR